MNRLPFSPHCRRLPLFGLGCVAGASGIAVSNLAPGARVVVRDEEWLVRRVEALPHEGYSVHVTGLSELVRHHNAIFLTTLDDVAEMRPEETRPITEGSVWTFNVAPDSGYGVACRCDFATVGMLTLAPEFKDWRMSVLRITVF